MIKLQEQIDRAICNVFSPIGNDTDNFAVVPCENLRGKAGDAGGPVEGEDSAVHGGQGLSRA